MQHVRKCPAVATYLVTVASMSLAERQPTEGYLPKFSRRAKLATRSRIPLRVSFPRLPEIDELPTTFGVPFPRGALKSADNVRVVTRAGREVPCGVRRTATWERPDGDVRWVLVDLPVKRGETYFVEYGTEVKRATAAGSLSVVKREGEIVIDTGPLRLTFSKRDSVLLKGAELHGRAVLSPSQQKRMRLVDEEGELVVTSDRPEDYHLEVEQAGPLHAVVKASGWYRRESGEKLAQYVARVHAYAGQPFVRVVHTFIVAYDTDRVRLRDICVPFVLSTDGVVRAAFGLDPDGPRQCREMGDGHLLQRRHDQFVLRSAAGEEVAEGERASGWFDMSTERGGLCVGLRHMWQEYPKELETAGREMRVHLWPPHGAKSLDWSARGQLGEELYAKWGNRRYHGKLYEAGLDQFDQAMGVAKTNELILSFHAGDRARAASQCATLETPLVVCADPEWMCQSDAFGRLGAKASSPCPEVERRMDEAFESFENMRRARGLYGMIHYGDVEGKGGRPWRRWASRFYGFPVVPWIIFARSGDPRYLAFGFDNAKHVMDIDMCHITNEDFGRYDYPVSRWGKIKGGRYGGDGGIIHYAGALYIMGCDSHVDQWLYAYYLTGYRRAWDVLLEEGEYYLELLRRDLDWYMRGYAHRMTGGALRTFIALYRATWDGRYLEAARRAAGYCYDHAGSDGIVRYDDVYMAPGLWTYYQVTGDERMRELFLRCMRAQSQDTVPLNDARLYSFYGPAMAYFATGDLTYLGRSVEWMDQFRGWSRTSYTYSTVHLQYLPYLVEALSTTDKPVPATGYTTATDGEILLRRDDTDAFSVRVRWACYDRRFMSGLPFGRWPEYCERHQLSARVVIRDAALCEVAAQPIALAGAPVRKGLFHASDEVELTVPPGPRGVYRLAIESSRKLPLMRLFLVRSTLGGAVYDSRNSYVAFGNRFYFRVPPGRQKFTMRLKAQVMRCTLRVEVHDPQGRRALKWAKDLGSSPLAEYQSLEWDVPPGSDGQLWSFSFWPRNSATERVYVQLDGLPWLANSPDAFFVPAETLAPRTALAAEDAALPGMGKFLTIPAGKALDVSRGAGAGPGRYERLSAAEGTIEFWLRPGWDADDLNNRSLVRCGKLYVYRRGPIGTYFVMDGNMMQSGFAMARRQWHHVAIAWGKAEGDEGRTGTRLFVDGVLLGQTSHSTSALGDWTDKSIRIGSAVPLDIDGLRVSDTPRHTEEFDPCGPPERDEHALIQLDFERPLPRFAKVR